MITPETVATKAVLITGASTGIGQACALHLDSLGWQVFAGVRKQTDAEALQRVASEKLKPIFIDVVEQSSVAAAADTVAEIMGQSGLAGLVNNAGIAVGGPLEYLPLVDIRHQFEINVIGQIAVIQAFLPLLRQARGRIINMSSISGRVASPFLGPYAASKFALEAITDSLRLELRPWGIEVISIQPGAIATPIWNKSFTRAEEMLRGLPVQAQALYAPKADRLREAVARTEQRASPAEEVAQAVAQALAASRPKTRYLVGRDAKMGVLLAKLLPDRWRDWLMIRQRQRG